MKQFPLISIIVPFYNAEKYLKACIESILCQSYQYFELLLINDGSLDNSKNICEEFKLRDSRVKVFHKQNGGVSSARNFGLMKAVGEWIYFVDADDTLFNNCLETLLYQTSDDIDCTIGGYIDVHNYTKTVMSFNEITEKWDYKTALLDFYKPIHFRFNGYLWNRLFRHSTIKDNNIRFHEDIFFKEDGLFIVEFICKSKKKLSISTRPIYNYYINPKGAMQSLNLFFNTKYLTNMDARILCWKNIKDVICWKDIKLKNEAQKSIVQLYYMILDLITLHNVNDKSIKKELHRKMSKEISVPILYFYRISFIFTRFNYKLKSFICRRILCLKRK